MIQEHTSTSFDADIEGMRSAAATFCDGAHSAATLGAARLAMLALARTVAEVCKAPAAAQFFTPERDQENASQERYLRFRDMYRNFQGWDV